MAFCLKMKSDYSFLSSTLKIDDMISFCKANHFSYCSLIDNNLFGTLYFYNACLANNLKPIIGLELFIKYEEFIFPLIFIAKNENGYKNLSKLSSISCKFNTTYIDAKVLSLYAQDLILVISSEDSFLNYAIKNNMIFEANEYMDFLKSIYSEIYLGVYRYRGIDNQILESIKEYTNQVNIKSIAMQYVLHKNSKDTVILNLLDCIKKGISANKDFLNIPSISQAYLLNQEQLNIYYDTDELNSLDNMAKNISLKLSKVDFSLPNLFKDCNEKIRELSYDSLKKLNLDTDKNYVNRLEYELSIITKMGFSNYYLIVSDYVNYAKNNNIPVGPSRGSGGASLVAYLLNINNVDPLKHDLLFERFLNPSRINYPDFDIDFSDIKRDEVIKYVKEKYGNKKVAHIATFSTFGPKSAIRDIARLLKTSSDDVDYIIKTLSNSPKSINDEYKNNLKFKSLLDIHGDYKTICSLASQIEGLKRQVGLHAAGMIISSTNLDELVPTFENDENSLAIQYDYIMAEKYGLIKMDFLGLKNLSIIEYCVEKINEKFNENFTIDTFPYDDSSSYEMISSGDTLGLFQLESEGMINVIKKLKPSCFDDVIALLALYRPGPMDMIPSYIERKFGKKYQIDDSIADILKPTYGIIIYQEQIMQICQKVASYTLGDADILRRAISKKDHKAISENKQKFIDGCLKNNYSLEKANNLFSLIEKFASYGFNKAHSVGYAIIATMMAYIKANYKTIFYEALLNVNQESGERKKKLFNEAKKYNISILKPCIKTSMLSYSTTENSIMFGLTNISTIKENIANIIINERKKAPFNDLNDFVIRMAINEVSVQVLIDLTYAGALDCFNISKEKILGNIKFIYSCALMFVGFDYEPNTYQNKEYENLGIKMPLLLYEDDQTDLIKKEYEMLGIYLSLHPLTILKQKSVNKFSSLDNLNQDGYYDVLVKIISLDIRKTKDNKDCLIIKIEDETSSITIREYKNPLFYKNSFVKGNIVKINLTNKNGYFYLNKMEKVEVEK